MLSETGSDAVGEGMAAAAVACEYNEVSVALERVAALSAIVIILLYAVMVYANRLLSTLSADVFLPTWRWSDGISGLDDTAIARLHRFVFISRGDAAATECAVCLGAIEEGETAWVLPCCAHAFHASCVDAWLRLRPTCPFCRVTYR